MAKRSKASRTTRTARKNVACATIEDPFRHSKSIAATVVGSISQKMPANGIHICGGICFSMRRYSSIRGTDNRTSPCSLRYVRCSAYKTLAYTWYRIRGQTQLGPLRIGNTWSDNVRPSSCDMNQRKVLGRDDRAVAAVPLHITCRHLGSLAIPLAELGEQSWKKSLKSDPICSKPKVLVSKTNAARYTDVTQYILVAVDYSQVLQASSWSLPNGNDFGEAHFLGSQLE